jgi:hypothetical protein
MIRLYARPLPPSIFRQQIVSLSQSSCVSPPVHLIDGRGGGEGVGRHGRGAESYDRKKAWASINRFNPLVPAL